MNRPRYQFHRDAVCAICVTILSIVATQPVAAQLPTPTPSDGEEPVAGPRYDEVVVTGAPVPRSISDLAAPAAVLQGEDLTLNQAPQLGEVLATQPGVTQTYFGPGASRPIIRGLGGDNIRVLENGLGLFDASSVSPDHAVALEPLLTKQIEIVRGPAALLYGPTAIGGVVNAITNRIPDEMIDTPVRGKFEARGATVNTDGAGVAMIEGGHGGFAYHLDGFGRQAQDLSIPGFARSAQLRATDPLPPGEEEARGILPNSAIETHGGSAGASYVWDNGYFGLAPSVYQTTYGTVAEPDVTIDMRQRRLDFAGALYDLLPHLSTLKAKLGLVDYEHTEFEGEEPGTVFKNRGYDLRLDGLHDAIGGFEGALGFESYLSDFEALGDEAFMPPTTTATQSLFLFEEKKLEPVRLQMAGRLDYAAVDADASDIFGPADSRDFVTGGASLGAIYTITEPYDVALSVAYTQRAPNAQELYADGPHLATGQFEVGNRELSIQESLGIDLTLRRTLGRVTGSIGGFYNHFINYIGLIPTGQTDPTFDLPIFVFQSLPATFAGMEAEMTIALLEQKPYTLDLNLKSDYVYTRDRDTGVPLPFVPPFRFGSGLSFSWDQFGADLSMLWARKQDDVPVGELPTDGYTMVNASTTYRLTTGMATVDLFLRGMNLLNQNARDTTSVLKDVAPLPGIGGLAGFRVAF